MRMNKSSVRAMCDGYWYILKVKIKHTNSLCDALHRGNLALPFISCVCELIKEIVESTTIQWPVYRSFININYHYRCWLCVVSVSVSVSLRLRSI